MCWVHEWAKARRSVLKARVQAERFPKKRGDYLEAAKKCEEISARLQEVAEEIMGLIERYGIRRGGKELERLLQPPRLQKPDVWAELN